MFRTLKYIILVVLLSGLVSCADDFLGANSSAGDELPVDFELFMPNAYETRSIQNPKTEFKGGDILHIQGTFKMKDGTADVVRYGALKYNDSNKKWKAVEGSELTWPTLSESGQFLAYCLSRVDDATGGILNAKAPSITHMLADIKTDSDPLKAESDPGIGYGHAVKLQFKHLCTYLTLNYLEPMVAESYWFTRESTSFNNAFRLTLDPATNKLNFEFFRQPDDKFKGADNGLSADNTEGLVYISSPVTNIDGFDESGNPIKMAQTNYFLEPGMYDEFSLRYDISESASYEYLKYNYNPVGDSSEDPNKPLFESGVPYTLDISKSLGVTISKPKDRDEWDDGGIIYDVDVEQFLRAIKNQTDYEYEYTENGETKKVKVLTRTSEGTKLMYNVNFRYKEYDVFTGEGTNRTAIFEPNVNAGSVFDGGGHYIYNLGSPLFYTNYGTIQNLGIKNIDTSQRASQKYIISEEKAIHTPSGKIYDRSRTGGICMINSVNGTIHNVRIEGVVNLDVRVESKKNTGDSGGNEAGSETHFVGAIVGENNGSIENVDLSGNVTLAASNNSADVQAQVLIGGIVGQNAGSGEISNVVPAEDGLAMNIVNKCTGGLGAFYVGGIAGISSGKLYNVVIPSATVDGSASSGVTSNMGGIAGALSANTPIKKGSGWVYEGSVEGCIANGTVKAGKVKPYMDVSCYSYAGGIAGVLRDVPVSGCNVSVSVYGTTNIDFPSQDIIYTYATGGAFGRILISEDNNANTSPLTPVEDIIAYGSALSGLTNTENSYSYIGNFAGLVQQGVEWGADYAKKNIIVNNHSGYQQIGGTTVQKY